MKYCFNCGNEIKEGTKFCKSCGANQESKIVNENDKKSFGHFYLKNFVICLVMSSIIYLLPWISNLIGKKFNLDITTGPFVFILRSFTILIPICLIIFVPLVFSIINMNVKNIKKAEKIENVLLIALIILVIIICTICIFTAEKFKDNNLPTKNNQKEKEYLDIYVYENDYYKLYASTKKITEDGYKKVGLYNCKTKNCKVINKKDSDEAEGDISANFIVLYDDEYIVYLYDKDKIYNTTIKASEDDVISYDKGYSESGWQLYKGMRVNNNNYYSFTYEELKYKDTYDEKKDGLSCNEVRNLKKSDIISKYSFKEQINPETPPVNLDVYMLKDNIMQIVSGYYQVDGVIGKYEVKNDKILFTSIYSTSSTELETIEDALSCVYYVGDSPRKFKQEFVLSTDESTLTIPMYNIKFDPNSPNSSTGIEFRKNIVLTKNDN